MHLVEILLPVADNEGQPFDARKYEEVGQDLSRRFGGVTKMARAPAQGTSEARDEIVHDDIAVFEVITRTRPPLLGSLRRRLEPQTPRTKFDILGVAIARLRSSCSGCTSAGRCMRAA
jgi:hypothetical protein